MFNKLANKLKTASEKLPAFNAQIYRKVCISMDACDGHGRSSSNPMEPARFYEPEVA